MLKLVQVYGDNATKKRQDRIHNFNFLGLLENSKINS